MQERRKSRRTELQSRLVIKRIDEGKREEVAIDITDVSKGGIGFDCAEALEIGATYESFLTIWTKEVIHAFVQIIRIELKGDIYSYGASFVGLPEMEGARIVTYQTVSENGKDAQ
jgi:hypothetical protein